MPSSGSGAAASPITSSSDYTTVALLKARLGIQTADTSEDTLLAAIITAVSRMIDTYCDRRFYPISETRYFSATQSGLLLVDDFRAITSVLTDQDGDGVYETTWQPTDYRAGPVNALALGQLYWQISPMPFGSYRFPCGHLAGAAITADWGPATPPAEVSEACLFQASLNYAAKDAPGGTRSGGDFATQINAVGLHPFCRQLLAPWRRLSVG